MRVTTSSPGISARLIGALAAALAALFGATAARADVIGEWSSIAGTVLAAHGAETPAGYALVHVAMYDAVNAIDGRFAVFAVRPDAATRGASKEAAAAAAAYRVLLGMFPDSAEWLAAAYDASLAALPAGPERNEGVAIGTDVAAAWLTRKIDVAPGTAATYVLGGGPQGFADLTSERYVDDSAPAAAGGREESKADAALAPFYAESPTTFFARNLRDLAAVRGFGIETNARLFALVHVTQAASTIACGSAEYECLGPAFAESLRQFFGTSYVKVTLTSTVSRAFDNTGDIIDEIEAACVFGGKRDRASVEAGTIVGRKVARRVATDFELVAHGH